MHCVLGAKWPCVTQATVSVHSKAEKGVCCCCEVATWASSHSGSGGPACYAKRGLCLYSSIQEHKQDKEDIMYFNCICTRRFADWWRCKSLWICMWKKKMGCKYLCTSLYKKNIYLTVFIAKLNGSEMCIKCKIFNIWQAIMAPLYRIKFHDYTPCCSPWCEEQTLMSDINFWAKHWEVRAGQNLEIYRTHDFGLTYRLLFLNLIISDATKGTNSIPPSLTYQQKIRPSLKQN